MSVNDPGGDNDSGAFGVLLNGDRNDVANNTISGSDALLLRLRARWSSGRGLRRLRATTSITIWRSTTTPSQSWATRGRATTRSPTTFPLVPANSIFVVTRGSGSGYGPVANTRLLNNTVVSDRWQQPGVSFATLAATAACSDHAEQRHSGRNEGRLRGWRFRRGL